jgi:hypothetical protein
MSDNDVSIAKEFEYKYIGSRLYNIGIAAAYRELIDIASGDLFLFLENDWELVDPEPTYQIKAAQHLLYSGVSDLVRLRSRNHPGSPLWTLQFAGREKEHPTHLLDAVHWMEDPTQVGLEKINLISGTDRTDTFYMASAKNANWTNNPYLAPTKFLRKNILPNMGGGDIEIVLQSWWQEQDFKVAQGEGMFRHCRLDR